MISNTRYHSNCGTCNTAEVHKFLGLIQSKLIANGEYKAKSVANGNDLKSMIRFLWTETQIVYTANRYQFSVAPPFEILDANRGDVIAPLCQIQCDPSISRLGC